MKRSEFLKTALAGIAAAARPPIVSASCEMKPQWEKCINEEPAEMYDSEEDCYAWICESGAYVQVYVDPKGHIVRL